MAALIVIPARYQSSRFPGKPLAKVCGKTVIERVWRIASRVCNQERVLVATDDQRIAEHVANFGGEFVMTPRECTNGTERALEALRLKSLRPDIVVNLQGDSVILSPSVVERVIDEMQAHSHVELATAAYRLDWSGYDRILEWRKTGNYTSTLVVFDKNRDALYFSRALMPVYRKRTKDAPYAFQHIGIYAYRYEALERYVELSSTSLEEAEMLEQLRVLENGGKIRVVVVDLAGRSHCSIDSPEDIERTEKIISCEGELF